MSAQKSKTEEKCIERHAFHNCVIFRSVLCVSVRWGGGGGAGGGERREEEEAAACAV